jgi:histidinol-phosphate aminotransferase
MSVFDEPPLRDELRNRTPYGPPQHEGAVRLDTTENAYGLPEQVVDAVLKAVNDEMATLNRYPDLSAMALREDLAAHLGHDLTPAHVWVGNGTGDLHQQVLHAFGGSGRTAMGFQPSWFGYETLAAVTGTGWLAGQRDAQFGLGVERAKAQVRVYQPDVVFVASPNDPSGGAVGLDAIETIASEAPGVVVVDEAFHEFARPDTPSALSLLPRYPRLVVTRTLSATFAVAGLRLGYLAAAPAMVEALRVVRVPYHLSSLTQAAARAALAHAPQLLSQVDAIKADRDRIVTRLRELDLTVIDSDANFVLFGQFKDQHEIWQKLLNRGVLVAEVKLDGWLRVTVGTRRDVDTFLQAMEQVRAE